MRIKGYIINIVVVGEEEGRDKERKGLVCDFLVQIFGSETE